MIRWQGFARESRTAVNSHFLAYASAVLAFQASILTSKDVIQIYWPCIYAASGLMAIASIILGSTIVIIRLRDARLTARTARYRYENRPDCEVEALRACTNTLGNWTNRLIPWQVITFVAAALFFITWVVVAQWGKFVPVTG